MEEGQQEEQEQKEEQEQMEEQEEEEEEEEQEEEEEEATREVQDVATALKVAQPFSPACARGLQPSPYDITAAAAAAVIPL